MHTYQSHPFPVSYSTFNLPRRKTMDLTPRAQIAVENKLQEISQVHTLSRPQELAMVDLIAWTAARFAEYAAKAPHFEASLYGPVDLLLRIVFSPQLKFLIKSQPKIRRDALATHRHNISTDSYNAQVSHSASWEEPDFVVARGTNSATGDRLCLIVEVKPNASKEAEHNKFVRQLSGYAQIMQAKTRLPTHNYCILVELARISLYTPDAILLHTSTNPAAPLRIWDCSLAFDPSGGNDGVLGFVHYMVTTTLKESLNRL